MSDDPQAADDPSGSIVRHWVQGPTWPPGPWTDEPDEALWIDPGTGLTCHILRHDWGFLCGYVAIPEGHPLYGNATRTKALLAGHHGINFADWAPDVTTGDEDGDQWWAGFDCGRHGDVIPHHVQDGLIPPGATYRNWRYVKTECESLARQITALARPASEATAGPASRRTRPMRRPTAPPPADPPDPDRPAE